MCFCSDRVIGSTSVVICTALSVLHLNHPFLLPSTRDQVGHLNFISKFSKVFSKTFLKQEDVEWKALGRLEMLARPQCGQTW